jgi:hypothetical protein
MDDANADVDNGIVRNGMLGKAGECSSLELACGKEFIPLLRMPL